MLRRALWAAVVGLLGVACTAPPLTPAVVSHFSLGSRTTQDEPLSRLQVYASDDIVLERELDQPKQENTGLVETSRVELVRVASGTPGVVLRVERDPRGRPIRLHVGFDPNHPTHTLTFGVRRDRSDVDVEEDKYRLLPTRGIGVRYGKHMYRLADPRMWDVHLTYEGVDVVKQEDVDEPPGWRLDGANGEGRRTSSETKEKPANSQGKGKVDAEGSFSIGTGD